MVVFSGYWKFISTSLCYLKLSSEAKNKDNWVMGLMKHVFLYEIAYRKLDSQIAKNFRNSSTKKYNLGDSLYIIPLLLFFPSQK